MKKIFTLFAALTLIGFSAMAQVPQSIPYQAVARNTAGNLIASQNVSLRFSVHDATSGGTVVYQETQSATTSSLGMFSVNIGTGTPVTGTFSGINWGTNSKFMQVEIDPTGGTSYVDMGTQQMMSVPYALYAANANSSNFVDLSTTQTVGGAKTFSNDAMVHTLTVGLGSSNIATNTALGFGALAANTTGSTNTALGYKALNTNTTGEQNTAIGRGTLLSNTTGMENTAIGRNTMFANVDGIRNTGTGLWALNANTSGSWNTANGGFALRLNTTGNKNAAFGFEALYNNTVSENTAMGYEALYNNTTGTGNVALGFMAGFSSTNQNGFSKVDYNATFIGYKATREESVDQNTTLTNVTAIGANAKVATDNTIQLGDANVTLVNTSGNYKSGTVTYPNAHGSAGQVLSTTGSGTLTWITPNGSNGLSAFSDFFALMPGDNAATIAVGASVLFPQDGPNNGVITRTSTSTFNLPTIGTYEISFQVSVDEAGQLIVTLNSIELAYTVVGRATGTSQITGTCLVTTTTSNSILTINNPSGNSTSLTIIPISGGTHPVSAHLVIKKLD